MQLTDAIVYWTPLVFGMTIGFFNAESFKPKTFLNRYVQSIIYATLLAYGILIMMALSFLLLAYIIETFVYDNSLPRETSPYVIIFIVYVIAPLTTMALFGGIYKYRSGLITRLVIFSILLINLFIAFLEYHLQFKLEVWGVLTLLSLVVLGIQLKVKKQY